MYHNEQAINEKKHHMPRFLATRGARRAIRVLLQNDDPNRSPSRGGDMNVINYRGCYRNGILEAIVIIYHISPPLLLHVAVITPLLFFQKCGFLVVLQAYL